MKPLFHPFDSLAQVNEHRLDGPYAVRIFAQQGYGRRFTFESGGVNRLLSPWFARLEYDRPALTSPSGTGVENGKPAQDQHGPYRHVVFASELLHAAGRYFRPPSGRTATNAHRRDAGADGIDL